MKSTEVYSVAREVLAPWCKDNGFKRTTSGGMLGWYKPLGDRFIVFWFQVSQDGWRDDIGSSFTVEFQISDDAMIGTGTDQRWRLPKFLSQDELEQVGRIQNHVISKLKGSGGGSIFGKVASWYRTKSYKYAPADIWLRYSDKEDVELWANFVKEKLPHIVKSLSADGRG